MVSFISSIKVDTTFDNHHGLNNKQIRPVVAAKLNKWTKKTKSQ